MSAHRELFLESAVPVLSDHHGDAGTYYAGNAAGVDVTVLVGGNGVERNEALADGEADAVESTLTVFRGSGAGLLSTSVTPAIGDRIDVGSDAWTVTAVAALTETTARLMGRRIEGLRLQRQNQGVQR